MTFEYRHKFPTGARAKQPPKRGIKVRKIGATWWGQKWIEALERMSRDYLNRLGRGRSYARAGRVHDMHIKPGLVSALVTGSDSEPYSVTLRVAMLPPITWQKAIEAMSHQAVFAAELLSGHMPEDIEQTFRAAGHSVFPLKQREIETDCSCPDWANPCKHVAAVHYVLGEAFDKDPFLLFELRGRTRQQVLGALSALRSGDLDDPSAQLAATVSARGEAAIATDGLDERSPEEFERWSTLPHLQFSIDAPISGYTLLTQLGAPASWPQDDLPYDDLVGLYRDTGQLARDLALGLSPPLTQGSPAKRLRTKLKPALKRAPRSLGK
jgi:uncharacterized Zn finger protein